MNLHVERNVMEKLCTYMYVNKHSKTTDTISRLLQKQIFYSLILLRNKAVKPMLAFLHDPD
jgi:hypothetical protein